MEKMNNKKFFSLLSYYKYKFFIATYWYMDSEKLWFLIMSGLGNIIYSYLIMMLNRQHNSILTNFFT